MNTEAMTILNRLQECEKCATVKFLINKPRVIIETKCTSSANKCENELKYDEIYRHGGRINTNVLPQKPIE